MLDILGNIDTVNYFVQDALVGITSKPLQVRNNFHQGDGYIVDITEPRKNVFNINIATTGRNNIARIIIDKNEIVLRYNAKFMMFFKSKTDMFSTNLFDEPFKLEDIEAVFFTQSTCFKFRDVEFSPDVMTETLQMLRIIYYGFNEFAQERNQVNNCR